MSDPVATLQDTSPDFAADAKIMRLTTKVLPLDQLKAHPDNPRIHPKEGSREWNALSASLAHSYFDPLVWNESNGCLVSGHLRTKILGSQGVVAAEVVVVNYSEQEHKARMLAANKSVGRDNPRGRDNILRELLQAPDFEFELTGQSRETFDTSFLTPIVKPKKGDVTPTVLAFTPDVNDLAEYLVISCENAEEWKTLADKLGLAKVKATAGSTRGLQHIIPAKQLLTLLK